MNTIKLITSTTREGRKSRVIADFMLKEIQKIDTENKYELLDLGEINLPFFDEPNSPMNQNYVHDHTKNWSKLIDSADAFIVVLAEYNGSYPAPIKNAFDFLYNEWLEKPVSVIGYGGRGALWATDNFINLVNRFKMKVSNNRIHISSPWDAIDKDGNIDSSYIEGNLQDVLVELNGNVKK